ncbi:flavin reductase family protein [Permianibacter sp. IMCC34836]|uniref:flavin reductase family protein n=1 Tax=Permianibacter fluminis TaxID=2738515 RepID=UPI001554F094|nr:flavin reductase family protein [Permianibacter fluminis]NQD38518.1 flavin reductase family protein [Permianibacter fluminis]
MPQRRPVDLAKCYKLLTHGPVTLVTSAHQGQRNIMAASWAMPLDFDPPKLTVVIDANTLTRKLVDASGEFALQIPTRAIARETLAVGSVSGVEGDKFARFGIDTFAAQHIAAPLVHGCVGWLECRVIADASRRYDLFIAEVLAAYADDDVFSDGRWHFPADPLRRTMHYMAGGEFFATGESFRAD